MKKIAILTLVIFISAGALTVSAQTPELPAELLAEIIDNIGSDFELLLDGLGNDIDTILLQNAMSGQNIGMAELGSGWFSTLYFGLPAINLTVANGFLTFRNNEDYFNILDLNGMLNDLALGELYESVGAENSDYVDLLLDQATPIPALKLNLGFKLPANLELIASGIAVPTAVMGMITDSGVELPGGLTFNYINAGGVLRYVLLRDSKQTPGMSIGLGGYYNNLELGMDIGGLLGGDEEGADPEADAMSALLGDASVSIGSNAIAFGIDVAMSKRLIGVFIPYLKLGAWYSITDTGGTAELMEDVAIESSAGHNDLDLLLDTGFDLALGPVIFNIGGDYNLGSGVWGVDLGMRLQF